MTEQSKEYIITDCLIQKWLELDYSVRDIATEIRSGMHPVSTPPKGATPENGNKAQRNIEKYEYETGELRYDIWYDCQYFASTDALEKASCIITLLDHTGNDYTLEEHDAAIREETLDKVIAILKSESGDCPDDTKCSDEDYGTKDCSICWIESLRQPKQKKEVPK